MQLTLSAFYKYLCGSWLSYFVLVSVSHTFKLYEYFPGIGFIGYGLIICLLLVALNKANKQKHYLLVGANLILFGAIASFDIVVSKQEIAEIWVLYDWFPLTGQHVEGYMQIIIILLNIFTGSLAASCLFYGLNPRNFQK